MDEYFDTSRLGPGSSALIETEDTMELGVILHINYEGVLINSTHRMDVIGLVSDGERDKLRSALADTPTRMLRIFAREAGVGFVKSYILKREELISLCLVEAVETQNELGSAPAMVPLMKPIGQWIPRERIKKIMDSSDYMEEKFLRELDFSLGDELE